MSQSCNYGCADLPQHQQVDCNEYANGGISAAAVLECDHLITDFSNATQWQTAINTGKAKLILNIKGEITAPAPAQVDNPVGCGAAQILLGFDNTASWTDANVLTANDDFYSKLNLRKLFIVLFMCEQDEIRVSNSPVTFTAIPVTVSANNREMQLYNASGAFFSKSGEVPFLLYDAPAGIFN